jgi:hypothetical protein
MFCTVSLHNASTELKLLKYLYYKGMAKAKIPQSLMANYGSEKRVGGKELMSKLKVKSILTFI